MMKAILVAVVMIISFLVVSATTPAPTAIEVARMQISDGVSALGALHVSDSTLFSKGRISGEYIAERTSLVKGQICMSLGELEGTEGFDLIKSESEHVISYNGSSSYYAKIVTVCNRYPELLEDIETYGFNDYKTDCSICREEKKCCLLLLKKSEIQGQAEANAPYYLAIEYGIGLIFLVPLIIWLLGLKKKSVLKEFLKPSFNKVIYFIAIAVFFSVIMPLLHLFVQTSPGGLVFTFAGFPLPFVVMPMFGPLYFSWFYLGIDLFFWYMAGCYFARKKN